MKTFGQVLEEADALSPEEQESLVSILQRRLREQRRAELVRTVKEARKEFKAGRVRPASAAEITKKILA
jgi:phage-related baseplate assembly protein